MEKELKCPKCGSANVVDDDTYNASYGDGEIIYDVCGHCENCGASLQWEEIYSLARFENLHAEDDEEEN